MNIKMTIEQKAAALAALDARQAALRRSRDASVRELAGESVIIVNNFFKDQTTMVARTLGISLTSADTASDYSDMIQKIMQADHSLLFTTLHGFALTKRYTEALKGCLTMIGNFAQRPETIIDASLSIEDHCTFCPDLLEIADESSEFRALCMRTAMPVGMISCGVLDFLKSVIEKSRACVESIDKTHNALIEEFAGEYAKIHNA